MKATTPKKSAAQKKKTGRPTKRTPAVIRRIIAGLSKGTPLAVLCRNPGMPDARKVYEWAERDPVLSACIAHARILGYDAIAADCLEIADDRGDDPASRRVRTDVRLKLLAKWDPKRYGERLDIDHSGSFDIVAVIGGNEEARE